MKKWVVYILLFFSVQVTAQSRAENVVWKNVVAVNNAIFGEKNKIVLMDLIREDVSYGHSGGNIEGKVEMVNKAMSNSSVYQNLNTEKLSINIIKKTAIVRHILSAMEVKANGDQAPLKLSVLQVWIKQSGKWQLASRQAVKAK